MLRKLIAAWKADNLLKQAWQQSYQMLEIDQEMFLEASRVLRDSEDGTLRKDLLEMDKRVNSYEREVRRKVITHCSIQGGTAISSGVVLVSIVIDIERIGDYTKNIVELASKHPSKLRGGKYESDLAKVEEAVKDNFLRTKASIETNDPDFASKLIDEYEWVNPLCDKDLYDIIIEGDISISCGDSAALALYFRWLKRIYSHLRNINTSVINPVDGIGFKPGSF